MAQAALEQIDENESYQHNLKRIKKHQRCHPWKCQNLPPWLIKIMPKSAFSAYTFHLVNKSRTKATTSRHSMTKNVVYERQNNLILKHYQKVKLKLQPIWRESWQNQQLETMFNSIKEINPLCWKGKNQNYLNHFWICSWFNSSSLWWLGV